MKKIKENQNGIPEIDSFSAKTTKYSESEGEISVLEKNIGFHLTPKKYYLWLSQGEENTMGTYPFNA